MKSLTNFSSFSPFISPIFLLLFVSCPPSEKLHLARSKMSGTADGNVIDAVKTATDNAKENIKEFECPICLELILGAAILPCGHLSCIYCCHCSMNLENSHCFLCKKQYHALPGLSTQLSLLILSTFREQFDERLERERESSEEYEKFLLPFVKFLKEELKTNASALTESVTCTKCKRILVNPIAATCGHLYCLNCVRRGNMKKCVFENCYGGDIDKEAGVVKAMQHLLEKMYPLEIKERMEKEENEEIEEVMMMENVPSGEEGGQRGEEDDEKEEEVHFGVGCDLCGSYPIKGERYQCHDCKEDENGCPLGFDLCGKCKEFDEKVGLNETSANAYAAAGRFRFLQNHTREHRMVKVPFRESFLHRLKAANPQMSIEQILRIITIAGEEREQGEEGQEEEEEEEEEEREHEQEEGTSEESEEVMGHFPSSSSSDVVNDEQQQQEEQQR